MSTHRELTEAIAARLADYRAGELAPPSPEHVDRWVSQFSKAVQVPLLQELSHVFGKTYQSAKQVDEFLTELIAEPALVGASPRQFWEAACILDIQQQGQSQSDMNRRCRQALDRRLGSDVGTHDGSAGCSTFLYLDDVLFTGRRLVQDLSAWLLASAPSIGHVHVVMQVTHSYGEFQAERDLRQAAATCGKRIEFTVWRSLTLENRRAYKEQSEVLWPAVLPASAELAPYLGADKKWPFEPRAVVRGLAKHNQVFSSEEGRQLLEREFLLAGIRIRGLSRNPSVALRPLGFSPFGLGFGSTIVTHRNCPNNAPLALWWGDPRAPAHSPLSKWYPLVQRKPYDSAKDYRQRSSPHEPTPPEFPF